MTKVIANMSMSLDGYVADRSDGVQDLFGWYGSGDVEMRVPGVDTPFRVSSGSAAHLKEALDNVGALVSGRRNFDLVSGWGGTHPMGVPTFIVTHQVPDGWPREGSSIRFVTDGVAAAIEQAKEAAAGRWVGLATPDIARQCLGLGLLDAIYVDLVPVLLGAGVPFFSNLANAPVELAGPEIIEGSGVTHLRYEVRK